MKQSIFLRYIAPSALLIFLLVFWELYVKINEVNQMILPRPTEIATALFNGFKTGVFQKHLWVTSQEVGAGYLLGVFGGIALGIPIALSRTFETLVYPYVLALQAMPKIALAPLMMIWVGFGMESKIIITMIVSVFPILVNVIVGLRAVDPERLALVRSLNGGKFSELRWVRLPSAATFIFAGMKTSIVLAMLAAIAAEFVGAEAGLGFLMTQLMFKLDTPGVFAILIILSCIGIGLYMLADWTQRKIIFWDANTADRWKSK